MFGSSNIASGRKKIFGIVKKLLNLFGKISRKGILNSKKIMIAKKKKIEKLVQVLSQEEDQCQL